MTLLPVPRLSYAGLFLTVANSSRVLMEACCVGVGVCVVKALIADTSGWVTSGKWVCK